MKSSDPVLEQLTFGTEGVYSPAELGAKLRAGRRLRVKLGMDPTAPDLHLGHAVVLGKMRQFQDLGHQGVLIIGDYTARIGDPTGRDTTRPILDEPTIEANAKTYLDQAGKILDLSPEKLEVRRNSEWLSKLSFAEVLKLTGRVTVQQMLHRENFATRMEQGREIMVSEFMYPLMQGYDSVVVRADVELGGTDQTFNNLIGRDLMARYGLEKQVVLVMPILVGLDGHEKMSKSKGNCVAVADSPGEMFGKLMSIPDALMANYLKLLTTLPGEKIAEITDGNRAHPRDAKDTLARMIVGRFHGEAAAKAASEEFRRRFTEHQLPSDMPICETSSTEMPIILLLHETKFANSNSEARRLISQGAVTFDGVKITDARVTVRVDESKKVLKVGKLRVCQVVPKEFLNRPSGLIGGLTFPPVRTEEPTTMVVKNATHKPGEKA